MHSGVTGQAFILVSDIITYIFKSCDLTSKNAINFSRRGGDTYKIHLASYIDKDLTGRWRYISVIN